MSLYTDIQSAVFVWTNRPKLIAETDLAIKQALRTAHKAGSFYRDLVELVLTLQPTTTIQQLDMSVLAPRYRQLAYVKPTGADLIYKPITIQELMDQDGYFKTDIYYGVGQYLNIRANSPSADLTLCYYQYPTTNPIASIDSWIAEFHQDLIVLWASASILALIGETEVKTRVEALARIEFQRLIEDSTTIERR